MSEVFSKLFLWITDHVPFLKEKNNYLFILLAIIFIICVHNSQRIENLSLKIDAKLDQHHLEQINKIGHSYHKTITALEMIHNVNIEHDSGLMTGDLTDNQKIKRDIKQWEMENARFKKLQNDLKK